MMDLSMTWLDPVLDRCRRDVLYHNTPVVQTKHTPTGIADQVTDIDLAVESLLIDACLSRYPHASILSEETNTDPTALSSDICFVIDPIDGTKEMIAGSNDFAISVGMLIEGNLTAGVLDFPRLDQRFSTIGPGAAHLNGRPLQLPPAPALSKARVAVSPSQLREPSLAISWERLGQKTKELCPVGALTPKVASILRGQCHAALYLPLPNKIAFIWDYAVAALLLSRVGGVFISFMADDLLEGLPIRHDAGWIAGTPILCEQLRQSARLGDAHAPDSIYRDGAEVRAKCEAK